MEKLIKNNREYTLSFIFPVLSGIIGGVQVLFINLITYFIHNSKIKIRLYDYNLGLIRTKLNELNIEGYDFVPLDTDKKSIPNKGDEIFIMSNGGFLLYPHLFDVKTNTSILVWDVYYPFWNSFSKIKGVPIPGLKMKAMKLLVKKHAIIFMDLEGIKIFEENGIIISNKEFKAVFIPVYKYSCSYKVKRFNNEIINIGYIGRCAIWKINPIIKLLEDLEDSHKKYQLSIITDDPKTFSQFLPKQKYTNIIFHKSLFGYELEKFILSMDVGIGMGTAALDFAKLGVPTIIANPSIDRIINNYKYKWLYESNPGQLGEEFTLMKEKDKLIGKTWNEIELDLEKIISVSNSTINYVEKYHSIDNIALKLLENIKQTELIPSDLKSFKFQLYLKISKFIRRKNRLTLFEI